MREEGEGGERREEGAGGKVGADLDDGVVCVCSRADVWMPVDEQKNGC